MMKKQISKIFFKKHLEISTFIKFQYIAVRKGKTQSESEVPMNNMSEMDEILKDEIPDEELIDTLIAISVVSKRLAHKLRILSITTHTPITTNYFYLELYHFQL